jgi:tetratricopeptide (TPR) repeat protein
MSTPTPGRRSTVSLALALVVSFASLAGPALAQEARLGTIAFPNSGAPEAQDAFVRGVLLLHSFEFEDAAQAFRAAKEVDPAFALAYWGEAMTFNHPLWREQDGEAARATLARYAPTPDARAARAPTERERGYLEAIEALYGPGEKAERDRRYMEAMERLSDAYPDDLEARAFHALSILGTRDGERDFATYMRAAAVAQTVFDENPGHPGAAHYLIHAFDDPVHAPLGLPAARAYADIAPDAAHAQHMTSHIFVAMGMWDDVVSANVRARDVQNAALASMDRRPNVCGHYTSWLHYGWLMQGRPEDATRGLEACLDRVRSGARPDEIAYFVDMRGRQVLDTEAWDDADRFAADVPVGTPSRRAYDFVSAYAAVKRGDREGAAALLERMTPATESADGDAERARIQELEIRALLAVEDGATDDAVALLREAADLEAALPFEFGPPASLKPPHELLGEVLLDEGRAAEALAAFRRALELTPGRTLDLMGLAIAADQAGQQEVADDADARLRAIWRAAEPAFLARVR